MKQALINNLTKIRHDLHTLAETSNNEKKTSAYLTKTLKHTNPSNVLNNVGGHGLAVIYDGKESGPTILIRAELDALPIPESVDLNYRSSDPLVSHKCGHDGHMAIACGVGLTLKENPLRKGRVVLLFQPAEETGEGAEQVLNDIKFKEIQPDYIFALHNLPGFDAGEIIIKEGVFASASRGLIIRLKGKTSHAGHPEDGISPALAAASLIQGLTSLPSLYTTLHDASLITIIHVRIGEIAFGTMPGQAEVMATLRAYREKDINIMAEKALDLVKGISLAHGLKSETSWTEIFEANINAKSCVKIITEAAAINELKIRLIKNAFPWSEDFGRFTQKYDGALFGIGSGKIHPQLHSSNYDFPDKILPVGVNIFNSIIDRIFKSEYKP
ncbi:MAG: amidohydrolase [Balneolales bacterium]